MTPPKLKTRKLQRLIREATNEAARLGLLLEVNLRAPPQPLVLELIGPRRPPQRAPERRPSKTRRAAR